MNIDDILEMMDEQIDKAPTVPFSSQKCIIDAERMRDLINEIRLNLPQEIKRAKLIDFDCERIMKEAESKAENIVRRAEERAKVIVSQEEILKEAKQRANDVLAQAQSRAKEMRNAANEYIDNILNQTEVYLSTGLTDVKRTRQAIKDSAKGKKSAKQSNNG